VIKNTKYTIVLLLIYLVMFSKCIVESKKINMNHFWQQGEIVLPDSYEILLQQYTSDTVNVHIKLNDEGVKSIQKQIIVKDIYKDSMYVNDPHNEISELFEFDSWGRYKNGYFYQSATLEILDTVVTLDTINNTISISINRWWNKMDHPNVKKLISN